VTLGMGTSRSALRSLPTSNKTLRRPNWSAAGSRHWWMLTPHSARLLLLLLSFVLFSLLLALLPLLLLLRLSLICFSQAG
jgi:hypothetical protein